MYRSGDLGRYLADGNIEFVERIDDQVKVRGFRIELSEIEAVLAQHAGVKESVAIVTEDGSAGKRIVAYVVPSVDAEQETISTRSLRAFLSRSLPDYMVPSVFVLMDQLPLTRNGKVDRRALPAPDLTRDAHENQFVGPEPGVETSLAEIWAAVLGRQRVSRDANFFDLGGHSLLAMQVVARIQETFEIEFPIRHIFEAPTLAELAGLIVQEQLRQSNDDDVSQILSEIDQLSDEQARAMVSGQAEPV
jgi:surfactin family lipopeptide synthetase C